MSLAALTFLNEFCSTRKDVMMFFYALSLL